MALTTRRDGLCRVIAFEVQDTEPTNLCIGDNACDPGTGVCRAEDGEPCSSASQCLSGSCVDNVCCVDDCDTSCRACRGDLTGGADGECRPLAAAGTDTVPTNLCVGAVGCPGGAGCSCEAGSGLCLNGNGVACSSNGECLSNRCVDGFCCNAACGESCDACNVAGAEGTCTPVAAGTRGTPSCPDSLLCGGAVTCPMSCGSDDGLCDTGFYCDSGSCLPKLNNGFACARDAECSSDECVEGVCCNAPCVGGCESCLAARQGTGGSTGQCLPVADGGAGDPTCGGNLLCDGTSRSCPGACMINADCVSGFFCDLGSCVLKAAPGTACTLNAECNTDRCVDGVCCTSDCDGLCESCSAALKADAIENGQCGATAALLDSGDECGLYYCDGAGSCDSSCASNDDSQCKPAAFCDASDLCVADGMLGDLCENNGDCVLGFCADNVCCDSECGGTCESCAMADTSQTDGFCTNIIAGTDPGGECGNYFCDGGVCDTDCEPDLDSLCKPGTFCDAQGGPANDVCIPLGGLGDACERATDCMSGTSCVDGVCCDSACTGTCRSCLGAQTGGSDGLCADITDGTDPAGECGGGLACNGGACPVTNCVGVGLCDGAALDCESEFYCDTTGTCAPKLSNGSVPDVLCMGVEGASCESTIVSDESGTSVCCDGACDQTCQSCLASVKGTGLDGVCGQVAENTVDTVVTGSGQVVCDSTGVGCAGTSCTCSDSGSCGSATGESCGAPTECWSGLCTASVCADP
ncbi:MAG: Dickkopf N-terminal cysteine-rich domain-containing protein [Myxococcota bacterium]